MRREAFGKLATRAVPLTWKHHPLQPPPLPPPPLHLHDSHLLLHHNHLLLLLLVCHLQERIEC